MIPTEESVCGTMVGAVVTATGVGLVVELGVELVEGDEVPIGTDSTGEIVVIGSELGAIGVLVVELVDPTLAVGTLLAVVTIGVSITSL